MSKSDFLSYPTGKIGKGEFCEECKRYNARHVTVEGVVVREGKILLIRREMEPEAGKWALPGGYLDWDETLEEGVLRELNEETGLEGKVMGLIGVYSKLDRSKDGRQNVGHAFEVEADGEAITGDEVVEVKWFGFSELPELIAFDHQEIIEDYLKTVLVK